MNILAIDFGTKNIGLAWCDTAIGAALPFGVVKNADELIKIIKEEKIDKIIIGLPVGLDGKENANTERVKNFSEELKNRVDMSIEYCDERFSSQAADRMGEGVSRDEKAAMILLQDYMDRRKK